MQFLSENRKQFHSIDPSSHYDPDDPNYKQQTVKALRVFELYHPDTVNKALRFQLMKQKGEQGAKLEEFVDAKGIREILHFAKSGQGLMEDDETFNRRGKKRVHPVHLQKYYKKLQEITENSLASLSPPEHMYEKENSIDRGEVNIMSTIEDETAGPKLPKIRDKAHNRRNTNFATFSNRSKGADSQYQSTYRQ